MAKYLCEDCHNVYDDAVEKVAFALLPEDWECPVCGAPKSAYVLMEEAAPAAESAPAAAVPDRTGDELEEYMADIRRIAETGESIDEAMRTRKRVISWDDILFLGGQLARLPLLQEEPVSTRTVIGPAAEKPLVIESPVFVSHMSFGALSKEAKIALAKGSAAAKTAMCSGEGGILEESIAASHRYIFEYVPNLYSVTPENLRRADAVEIKIGQAAKPGMGGHLPGRKVTPEIAAARGFAPGTDILSPAHFRDITTPEELRARISELRELSEGRPVGVKIAAGHIEEDIDFILEAGADFITLDGRPGGTGSSPKYIKMASSVPTVFALARARKHLDRRGAKQVSLIVTGGLRVSPDFAKALALGADAVAIATSALVAIGCRQFRMCNTGKCPFGVTSQDPELRRNLDVEESARRLANFLRVSTAEIAQFARIAGRADVHELSLADLCTVNSEISGHTDIPHC
ncbi:MAG: FMN-binding glutamate synthase family protein [Lentisphaeria bacterium]|nr:FMN-binding glutamate synthase family protein [Lentisphaeria bacterium]